MIVSHSQRVTWTYLVFQDKKPECGNYIDPRGYRWYVRSVSPEPGCVMREPSPLAWYVEMGPEHPFYKLDQGEELRRLFNSSEIAIRRELLTNQLRGEPGFICVGVSSDGFSLLANFSKLVAEDLIPTEIDGMSVVFRLLP
jgi:hypothetical protein